MLSGTSMGNHSMVAGSVSSMQMPIQGMTLEETGTGIEISEEGECLMEGTEGPIIAWLWKTFLQELLGRT